jgi:MOSC domain-containing protein
MVTTSTSPRGTIVALWRYPVKSMRGEELASAVVTDRGLLGDRAYALVDVETGKVVSAKNPRKWPNLLEFTSRFVEPPHRLDAMPPARITTPDGATIDTDDPNFDGRLSELVGRSVRLSSSAGEAPRIEGYWPDYDWLEAPDKVFEVKLPPGTFFDAAVVHVLTTTTLDSLRSVRPQSRFELPRFRPNIVVALSDDSEGFPENDWAGRTLRLGDEVRLAVSEPCPRCVMTTVSQGDLPKDPEVLRTVVQRNAGNVGVLASVIRSGKVRRGDAVVIE